jgi:carbon monoxide dehydrogenase subunit G
VNFDGSVVIEADAARVWEFLLDSEKVSACIPGVTNVQQIDDRTFTGRMDARVGPIAGKFTFEATIVESEPLRQLVARLEGKDSVTKGTVHSDTVVNLKSLNEHATELTYRAAVDVKGRLAIIGDMILRATASVLLQEVTARVKERVEEEARAADQQPALQQERRCQ